MVFFVCVLFCFWLCCLWDLSSPTRDQSRGLSRETAVLATELLVHGYLFIRTFFHLLENVHNKTER